MSLTYKNTLCKKRKRKRKRRRRRKERKGKKKQQVEIVTDMAQNRGKVYAICFEKLAAFII